MMTRPPGHSHPFLRLPVLVAAILTCALTVATSTALADNAEGKVPPSAESQVKNLTSLQRAELRYGSGAFDAAADELKPLLVDDSALSREEKSRLYILKARLDLAFGFEGNLDVWLGRAFKADPSVNMDPLKDPPQLVAKWSHLKKTSEKSPDKDAIPPGLQSPHTEVAGVDSRGKSFTAGLMPFGLAQLNAGRNKDAALFFTSSLACIMLAHDLPAAANGSNVWTTPRRREFFSGALLLGVYGYQILDMSPELFDRSPGAAQTVYAGLSLAPFGVGQLRNDEPVKAVIFALVEGAALAVAGFSEVEQHRHTALTVFAGSLVIGAIDATAGYRSMVPRKSAGLDFQVRPLLALARPSEMTLGLDFKILLN